MYSGYHLHMYRLGTRLNDFARKEEVYDMCLCARVEQLEKNVRGRCVCSRCERSRCRCVRGRCRCVRGRCRCERGRCVRGTVMRDARIRDCGAR